MRCLAVRFHVRRIAVVVVVVVVMEQLAVVED